jgi:diaminopimelate epimerase
MAAAATAAATGLRFSKMHGAGNDFVVLDLRRDPALARRVEADGAALCRALADRHTGAGCDQVLTIEGPASAGAVAAYRIWNADGSAAGQCGNGARCVAAWLVRDGTADDTAGFAIDSPAGRHGVRRTGAREYEVDMGVARFAPAQVPLSGDVEAGVDGFDVEVAGTTLRLGAVSMGNPHAVLVVDDVASAPVATLGPALQALPLFPQSVNVGFAQVEARDRIRLRVYERGAGETRACGSGACAAVAVLARRGLVDAGARVLLPGGALRIHYDRADDRVRMAGPVAFVYEGQWLQ